MVDVNGFYVTNHMAFMNRMDRSMIGYAFYVYITMLSLSTFLAFGFLFYLVFVYFLF